MKKFKRVLVAGMAATMLFGSALNVSAAGLRDIFDAKYYADSYADLKRTFGYDEGRLYNHFISYGLKEGRRMNPILDVAAYRKAYGDLNAMYGDNWDAYVNHFFTFGAREMRDKGVLFNPVAYADAYGDIKAAYGGNLVAIARHYLIFGKAENRTSGTANGYADMAAARKAEQEAQQVTSDDEWVEPSETPDTDVPGGDVPGGDVSGGDEPGGSTEDSDKPSGGEESGGDVPGGDEPGGNTEDSDKPSGGEESGGDEPGGSTEDSDKPSGGEESGGDVSGGDEPGGSTEDSDKPSGGEESGGNESGGGTEDSDKPVKSSVVWDYVGRTEYEYDERGNCITSTVYNLTGDMQWSNHFTYNSNDQLVYSDSTDSEGNCGGYDQYEYDGGKIQKKTCYYGDGRVSVCQTYEWSGNKVKSSWYDGEGNLIYYIEYEADSRLNFIREEDYSNKGELFAYYVYTYDENDNVLTRIGYIPDGTEVSNNSFTYYDNGTKKTETTIQGGYKEVLEYNENGSRVSFKAYSDDVLEEDKTYEYYTEGPLAMISCERYYSDGEIQYREEDYDEQGRMQKETVMDEYPDGRLYMMVREYADDGSYTISSKGYGSDGNLISKWSETYDAQDKKVNETTYIYLDGNVESVIVKAYENGRIMRNSVYEADGVTLISADVYTYVDTEYGYEETIEELDANGNVVRTYGYMCDENGDRLGNKNPASDGGTIASWHKGEYKNQSWFYTAEGKLRRKEIKNGYNVMLAVYEYEYDADGNQTVFELVYADGNWVRPSEGSGNDEAGGTVSGGDASNGVSGGDAAGN